MTVRWQLKLHKQAVRFLRGLPARTQQRVRGKLDALCADPFNTAALDIRRMAGEDGLWRLRIGPLRAIYEIQQDRLLLYVLTIGNRGDVYKGRD